MDPMGLEYLCLFLVYKSKVGERLYISQNYKNSRVPNLSNRLRNEITSYNQ